MNKQEVEITVKALKNNLAEAEKMWDNKESHAMIVGFLQGTIKAIISHLEEINNKPKQ